MYEISTNTHPPPPVPFQATCMLKQAGHTISVDLGSPYKNELYVLTVVITSVDI